MTDIRVNLNAFSSDVIIPQNNSFYILFNDTWDLSYGDSYTSLTDLVSQIANHLWLLFAMANSEDNRVTT